MVEISENLWLEVDPIGRILVGCDDRVVRIDVDERQQVIDFIKNADDYHTAQIMKAEAAREFR